MQPVMPGTTDPVDPNQVVIPPSADNAGDTQTLLPQVEPVSETTETPATGQDVVDTAAGISKGRLDDVAATTTDSVPDSSVTGWPTSTNSFEVTEPPTTIPTTVQSTTTPGSTATTTTDTTSPATLPQPNIPVPTE